MGLNAKMTAFCREYQKSRDKEKAAIDAGYAKKTAAKKADELLLRADIKEKISELDTQTKDQLVFTADTITLKYLEIYENCAKLVPRMVWDSKQHAYVESKTIFEMVDAKNAIAALDEISKRLRLDGSKISSDTVDKLYKALEAAGNGD